MSDAKTVQLSIKVLRVADNVVEPDCVVPHVTRPLGSFDSLLDLVQSSHSFQRRPLRGRNGITQLLLWNGERKAISTQLALTPVGHEDDHQLFHGSQVGSTDSRGSYYDWDKSGNDVDLVHRLLVVSYFGGSRGMYLQCLGYDAVSPRILMMQDRGAYEMRMINARLTCHEHFNVAFECGGRLTPQPPASTAQTWDEGGDPWGLVFSRCIPLDFDTEHRSRFVFCN